MLAAVSYDLLKTAAELSMKDVGLIGVGFIISFIIALAAMIWFLKLLVRYKLTPFAIYRIILAVVILSFIVV